MAQFFSRLSNKIYIDDSTTATNLRILIQFLLIIGMVAPLLTTMWDHVGGIIVHILFIYHHILIHNCILLLT